MSQQIYTNNAKSTLSGTITSTTLSIPVVDASSFPSLTTGDWAIVTLDSGTQTEIVKLIAPGKIGNNLQVDPAGRGWEGTTPLGFGVNSRVECRVTAGTLSNIVSVANNALNSEISVRSSADTTELNRATTAEATLQTNINAETTRAQGAEAAITTSVNNEITARQNAVAGEATARQTGDSNEAAARTAAINAISPLVVQPGMVIQWIGKNTSPMGGYIEMLTNSQTLNITTYQNLYNEIGTVYGGDGITTFVLPGVPVGNTLVAGTVGAYTIGEVIAHTHTYSKPIYTAPQSGSSTWCYFSSQPTYNTGVTGGPQNLAAGLQVRFFVKY